MENYKYSLTKRGKNICPACGRKAFVLYIDSAGDSLHSTVGKCDRADNCGHHYSPKQYFSDNRIPFDNKTTVAERNSSSNRPVTPLPEPSYIDMDIVKRTLTGYNDNRLIQYLSGIVGDEATKEAINRYFIGTSKHWDRATVFWQIDRFGSVRTGKIMQYDSQTGKRVKEPVNKISWVHSVLKLPDFVLSQCLFGEHLLKDATRTVAIVESEKTAVIASIYFPDMIWLACGGSEGLNTNKCAVLKGRNVILYPDAGKFDKWNNKAKELSKTCSTSVSSLIEEKATDRERQAGYDIADYLVRFSPSDFRQPQTTDAGKPVHENSTAYVSDNGILFIPTPPDRRTTYTVYPCVETYNKRSELPTFAPYQSVNIAGMKQVFINLNTLTI